jgi:mono/diheme cytochrome c family protein
MIRSLLLMALASGMTLTCSADPPRTSDPAPRIFTAAQARAGKVAYESSCGLCHQFNMQGRTGAPGELPDVNSLPENMIKTIDQNGEQVPPLVGPRFMAHWGAKSAKEYVARVTTAIAGFPPKNAGSDTALQLTAYFLQMNGAKPGKIPLSTATSVSLSTATGQGAP